MKHIAVRIMGTLFGTALFVLAVGVLSHELRKYGLHEIMRNLEAISYGKVALAMLFAACCYGALSCYDTLALRYLRHPLPYRRIALASFVGYAFAHNVGLSLITGTPMKYRIYSAWGLRLLDVVKVAAFCGLTFWTGFVSLAGVSMLFMPSDMTARLGFPAVDGRLLGILLLGLVGAYFVLSMRGRGLKIGRRTLRLPGTRFVIGQMAAGSCEWIFAAATLYILFVPALPVAFPAFLGIFLCAYLSGFVSQVPGGLGVFETIILLSFEKVMPAPQIMGALIAYRAIYYILPLIIATVLLVVHEVREKMKRRTAKADH